jgi:hypothetical protein
VLIADFGNEPTGFEKPHEAIRAHFGVRGHVRAFQSGDMSPHSKAHSQISNQQSAIRT